MLTARTKTGKTICLGYNYKKETLLFFRKKEEFVCPVCGDEVILKLGDQRIFHFAHKRAGTCLEYYEGETQTHMEGKLQLYHWLISQKIPAILEYYDQEIQQRPDIMFKYQGKKYALEYQCSPLPEEVFMKRTRTYLRNGYTPLWIISNQHLCFKSRNIVSLANFHYLFLRTSEAGILYIPAYCPEKQLIHFIDSIIPFSVKNAFVHHTVYPLEQMKLEQLLNPAFAFKKLTFTNWEAEIERFKLNWSLNPGARSNHFLQEMYNRNMNLFLLPSEIGLPVPHSLFIQTSAVVWQSYLFFDVLAGKKPGDLLTINEVRYHLKNRIERKEIVIRHVPQVDSLNVIKPINEYLFLLQQLGILFRLNETTFKVQQKIKIPCSNREKEEGKVSLYQKIQAFKENI